MSIATKGFGTNKNIKRRIDILRKVSIFNDTKDDILREIASSLEEIKIDKDDVVFKKGDMLNAMFIIVSGNVIVHDGSHIFTNFGKNDFFGEYSLIDSSVRSATVTATEATILLKLNQDTFNRIMEENVDVSKGVLKALIRRLRNNNILEERLTQNSLKIKNQRDELAKQRKELEELNATKDKFFTIIAHDLKNPFHTVIGLSELLQKRYDQYDEEKIKDFIFKINSFANNAYDLLENLLQWSRSQTGRISVLPQKVNVYNVVNEVFDLFEAKAQEKTILLLNNTDSSVNVFADENIFSTVIRNLVSNAIKFTPENGHIKVNVVEKDAFLEVMVVDTGVGISEEDLSKLFKINVHHSTSGTNSESGTGLGLIIVKEFVEKNGGNIRVESIVNKGSKFIFTVPLYNEERNNKD